MGREKGGFWVGLAAAVFYPLTGMLARRDVTHGERVPRQGPAILVLNHTSHLDIPYDAVFVHQQRRVPRFLAKHSLWNIPFVKRVLVGAGQIPVYRGSADAKQSLRAAHQALREGKLVVIYPEGTITKDPNGWPMHARTGVARLALDNDVPVIPIARWGTRSIYDHYTKKFRPFPRKTVWIRVGEPVDLSTYRGQRQTATLLREVTSLLMDRVTEMLADIRQEPAPEQPHGTPPAEPADPTRPAGATDSVESAESSDATRDSEVDGGAAAGEATR